MTPVTDGGTSLLICDLELPDALALIPYGTDNAMTKFDTVIQTIFTRRSLQVFQDLRAVGIAGETTCEWRITTVF